MTTSEQIVSVRCAPISALLPHVELRLFAWAGVGATSMTTAIATFNPGKGLDCHTHPCSEAVTVLQGEGLFSIAGRLYRLGSLDCVHIPAGIPHEPLNASDTEPLVVLSAFASADPSRDKISTIFPKQLRTNPSPNDPEHISRLCEADKYELAEGTQFFDLFVGRFGSVGICGGYGRFQPGTSLPCHIHEFDESITIVEGEAICEVASKRYKMSGYDTAFVPQGKPHRFLNESQKPMAMIWVYAGSEPSRSIVDVKYCLGLLPWQSLQRERSQDAR